MADSPTPDLLALITTDPNLVSGGKAPIFLAKDEKEQQELALWITRITNASAHRLPNGVMMLVVYQSSSH